MFSLRQTKEPINLTLIIYFTIVHLVYGDKATTGVSFPHTFSGSVPYWTYIRVYTR